MDSNRVQRMLLGEEGHMGITESNIVDFSSMPTLSSLLLENDIPSSPPKRRAPAPSRAARKHSLKMVRKRHRQRRKNKKVAKGAKPTQEDTEIGREVNKIMVAFSRLMEEASSIDDAPVPTENDLQKIQNFVRNELRDAPRDVRTEYSRIGDDPIESTNEEGADPTTEGQTVGDVMRSLLLEIKELVDTIKELDE
ncbi:hypothetical protein QR680_002491 [Steinernema hermaphroditum]|uniref:Uncharacterized protein n=1 Tax=Steinernema hermaphroditum TaxID=289476 RepID=A0AA39LIF9_9BILA|nr:hypothetical protein QR680_002491 [Steinernema hermaphroditum]